jgi:hypothetical protein
MPTHIALLQSDQIQKVCHYNSLPFLDSLQNNLPVGSIFNEEDYVLQIINNYHLFFLSLYLQDFLEDISGS